MLKISDGKKVICIGGSGRVSFWGAITSQEAGYFRISTENNYIYQHDNARYYVLRQTQTKLRKFVVHPLKWPAKSPDLNVIEYLLSIIDNKLKARSVFSEKELNEALSIAWLSIKSELCRKQLAFSMFHKIYKCIECNGKSIDC